MEQKYIAFISYRHAPLDQAVAKELHSRIEQFTIPRGLRKDGKKLGRVFRDLEELPASSNLSDDIYRALDNSENLIVVCSREMAKSPWVAREVEYFLQHHSQDNVYTVLVDGEPGEVFPKPLLSKTLPNGTVVDVEPLAVDVRSDSKAGTLKKLGREMNRLLAAMIGCPYDALVQRQQKRQRRRLLLGAGAVLAVALLFSGVMLVKNQQIEEKNQQLEQTNQQLEEQKREILLRESELLTNEAQQYLDVGAHGGALPFALEALYDENGERPYYAPAEQALIYALAVFDDDVQQLLIDQRLFQTTPAGDLRLSSSGEYLVTIDPYGMLYGYDLTSGTEIWSLKAEEATLLGSRQLLVCCDNRVFAADFATGTVLWDTQLLDDGEMVWSCAVALDGDETKLAVAGYAYSRDQSREIYTLSVVDTENGQLLQQVEFAQGQSVLSATRYPEITLLQQSCISPDGKLVAGAYEEATSQEEVTLHIYLADLEKQDFRVLDSQPVARYTDESKVYQMMICDNQLLVLQGSNSGDAPVMLSCWNTQTGALQWQTLCVSEDQYTMLMETTSLTATGRYCGVTCGSRVFLIDRLSGALAMQLDAEENFVLLEGQETGLFQFVLEDGVAGYLWPNGVGQISTEVVATLIPYSTIRTYGGSFMTAAVVDGHVETGMADTGYMAGVFAEDPRYIYITRAADAGSHFPVTEAAFLQEGERHSAVSMQQLANGKVLLGPIDLNSEQPPYYRYVLLDPADPTQQRSVYAGSQYGMGRDLYFTADGAFCLECGSSGNIKWYDTSTGAETVLSEKETVELGVLADTRYTTSRYISAGAVRKDGTAMAVRLEEQGLTLWLDGQEKTVKAPENAVLQQQVDVQLGRSLWVGENGWVIVSGFADKQDTVPDWYWCYDTIADTWSKMPVEEGITVSHIIMGKDTPRAVILDAEGDCWYYNLKTQTTLGRYSLLMSQDALEQAMLVAEDHYLLLKTKDKQVIVMDALDGMPKYQKNTDSIYALTCSEDQNGRIYISWQKGGVCVKLLENTWQELAQIEGMLGFDPVTRQILCVEYNEDFREVLRLRRLPDTAQLIEIGRQLLQQQ